MPKPRRDTFIPVRSAESEHRHGATGRGNRRSARAVALPGLVLGLVTVLLVVWAARGVTNPDGLRYAGKPVVAIVGDASAMDLASGQGRKADAIGTGLGARVVTRAETTARYVAGATPAPALTATTEVSALARRIPASSDVVVFAAGSDDERVTTTRLQQGVLRSVRAAVRAAPRARLVLMAPVHASAALRRVLRAVASLEHLVYADPKVRGWLVAAGDLSPDGRSVTAKGRADLARGIRALIVELTGPSSSTPPPSGAGAASSSTGSAARSGTASPTPTSFTGTAAGTTSSWASPVPSTSPTSPSRSTPSSSATPPPSSAPPSSAPPSSAPPSSAPPSSAPPSSAPPSSAPPSSAPSTTRLPRIPAGSTAYFFGDSWVHGESATNLRGFPFLTASRFGWKPVVDGKSGSGYIHSTVASSPLFPARAAAVPPSVDPNLVIVEGGLNDRMSDLSTLRGAAVLTWSRLQARFPNVPLVVVGPASPTLPVSAQLRQVDRILNRAADEQGLVYISPLQEGWFTASNIGDLMNAATLHPNDAGHAYYASRLQADLTRAMGS